MKQLSKCLSWGLIVLIAASCGDDDGGNQPAYNFEDQPLQGQIMGKDFILGESVFEIDEDDYLSISLFNEDRDVALPCAISNDPDIELYMPMKVGIHIFNELNIEPLVYFPEAVEFPDFAKGAVEILSITDTEITGRVDVTTPEGSSVNGNFKAAVCVPYAFKDQPLQGQLMGEDFILGESVFEVDEDDYLSISLFNEDRDVALPCAISSFSDIEVDVPLKVGVYSFNDSNLDLRPSVSFPYSFEVPIFNEGAVEILSITDTEIIGRIDVTTPEGSSANGNFKAAVCVPYAFEDQPAQGKVGGAEVLFRESVAQLVGDRYTLTLHDSSEILGGICGNLPPKSITIVVPSQPGLHEINHDDTYVYFWFSERDFENAQIGAVEILIITDTEIMGRIDAIGNDNNFVNGNFKVSICD